MGSLIFAGELFLAEAASGCEDEGHREAREGLKASKGGDPDVEHWFHVNRCSSRCCKDRSGKTSTHVSCLHQQRGENSSQQASREALASYRVGSDSSWYHT